MSNKHIRGHHSHNHSPAYLEAELRTAQQNAARLGSKKFTWTNHLRAAYLALRQWGSALAQELDRLYVLSHDVMQNWLNIKSVHKEYHRLVGAT